MLVLLPARGGLMRCRTSLARTSLAGRST